MTLLNRPFKLGQVLRLFFLLIDSPTDRSRVLDVLHIGGGITSSNAKQWLECGAEKVIVTSYLFPSAKFSLGRLQELSTLVGKDRLVVDVRFDSMQSNVDLI